MKDAFVKGDNTNLPRISSECKFCALNPDFCSAVLRNDKTSKKLQPVESWFVSFLTLGEGWHNYHHTFPWDYKAAEMSMHFNISASVIRLFEKLGLAYDLKSATSEMVVRHILKSGDGTHYRLGNDKAREAVTAIGILHPLNPSYNVLYESPNTVLGDKGLPLNDENDVIQVNCLNRNYPKA